MTYIGVIASAVLHVGGLFLLLTARAPDPLVPLGSDTPVAINIISVDEYNALTSRAPSQSTLAALRSQPEAPRAPVLTDANPIPDTLEADTPPPDAPDPSTDLVMRLPPAVLDIPPEADEPPQPEAPDVVVAPAPKPPLLDADALQDRGVDPADLGPPEDVRIAIAPPAPKPPRGAFDALPDIDTTPDEPPKPAETDGQGEEEVQPAPEPALAEPVETAQAEDPAPLATPLPVPKPRGSLTVASDEAAEPSPPPVAAQPVEPEPETPVASQLSEAELEEERRLMAALMEQMRATLPPSEEELRAAEEEARRKFAEEQQRLVEFAALDEAERRKREEEERAKALAEAERRARELAEARERELADLRAREADQRAQQAEQRRIQQEALEARRRADIEAQRLAQEQLDRQRREEARRQQDARELAARRQQLEELNATIAPENRANNVLSGAAPPAAAAPRQDSFLGGDQALASILGAAANAAQSASTGPSFGQGSSGARGASLTPGETQAVLNQLRRCWRVDTFSANARNLIVTFRAEIRQNGFVNQGTISLMSPNPVPPEYQIAVDRARTALQDLRCQPFALPPQKYNAWRDIVIRFDPAQMVLQ